MSKTKICITCKVEKAIEEYGKRSANKDGINNKCKVCTREYNRAQHRKNRKKENERSRQYYRDNRERLVAYRAEYYERNRDLVNAQKRKHYRENKEQLIKKSMEYHWNNRESELKRLRKRYADNKEFYAEQNRRWVQNNPERSRMYGQRYEARKNSVKQTLTTEEWSDILKYYNDACAYCGMSNKEHLRVNGELLHQDHVVPLIKKGAYSKENIVPACRSCNSSKGGSDMACWYKKHDNYDENRLKKIQRQIENTTPNNSP